jgi:hypothetical protein
MAPGVDHQWEGGSAPGEGQCFTVVLRGSSDLALAGLELAILLLQLGLQTCAIIPGV